MTRGGGHDVQRQGDELQHDEERDEVARHREEHHAAQREEHEREDLGTHPAGVEGLGLLSASGTVRSLGREGAVAGAGAVRHDQDGQQTDDEHDALGRHAEGVLVEARRQRASGAVAHGVPAGCQGNGRSDDGQHAQARLAGQTRLTGHEGLQEDAEDGCPQDDDDR